VRKAESGKTLSLFDELASMSHENSEQVLGLIPCVS
jgi:hypothetical protein